MSSLNQAFIKAYGKDPARPPATEVPGQATGNESSPAVRTIDSWYAADAWYRADAGAASAGQTVPAPHAAFAKSPVSGAESMYRAPAAEDLRQLAPATEETDYRLRPAEPVATPEVVLTDHVAPAVPKAAARPASTSPPATPKAAPAPVTYQTTPPADAYSLQQLCAQVQVISGWDAGMSIAATVVASPPMATGEAAVPTRPAANARATGPTAGAAPTKRQAGPESKPAEPKRQLRPDSQRPIAAPPPGDVAHSKRSPEKTAGKSAAPVAQMRLDAVTAQSVSSTPPIATASVTAAELKPQPPKAATQGKDATSEFAEPNLPVARQARPTPEPVPAKPLQPAWEVDRFQWPEHCRQLLEAPQGLFRDVGQRLASAAKEGLSILAITSTRRGEGRTTLALCLARCAALAGLKVALVDADGDNPQLVNELGVEASCGWHDVVVGQQPLAESAILSLEEQFTFFPWTTAGAIKSLNDPQVTRVWKQIAAAFELVILDLGPAPGRETRLFEDGENCPIDAAILVRDVRWTSALEAQRVAAQLVSAGVQSVGIAENFGPRNSG